MESLGEEVCIGLDRKGVSRLEKIAVKKVYKISLTRVVVFTARQRYPSKYPILNGQGETPQTGCIWDCTIQFGIVVSSPPCFTGRYEVTLSGHLLLSKTAGTYRCLRINV